MVEKKLNFNQPIPSVRRHSLMTPPQKFDQTKSEDGFTRGLRPHRLGLNSGPFRDPGSVPFQWERAPGQPKEQMMQQTQNENEGEDCDEAFVDDQLDSLSRAESFLSNSSLSTLAATNDRDNEPSGRFSMDPQTREQVKKEVVNQDKSTFWYRPTFAKSCSYYEEKEESENEHDQSENLTGICCLLPSSCIKSSVCILNRVPVMNERTQLSMFQARGVHSGTLSTDSLSEVENEKVVKTFGKTDEAIENKTSLSKEKEADNNIALDAKRTFIDSFGSRKSFKTLQDLLAAEDSRKELGSTSGVERAKTVEKKIQRATTLQNTFPVPPPLPRSPSDSWLFRTLPSLSANKASTTTLMSRFSNKS